MRRYCCVALMSKMLSFLSLFHVCLIFVENVHGLFRANRAPRARKGPFFLSVLISSSSFFSISARILGAGQFALVLRPPLGGSQIIQPSKTGNVGQKCQDIVYAALHSGGVFLMLKPTVQLEVLLRFNQRFFCVGF